MLWFILGMSVGGMVGLLTASMMFAAKYADEKQQKKEEKNENNIEKMTALFATALILLTALPISASAQSRIQIENADVFGTTQEIVIGDGLFIDHRNYWCMMHTTDSMRAVYCLEPGRSVSSGDVYETDDTYSYLDYVQNPTLTSAEIQQLLKRVFQHAYTGNLDTAESYFQYVATQLLVWEVVVGQRDMNFELADNGYDSVSLVLTCFENSYAVDKVGSYYLQYEEAIKNHAESVSFAYSSEYDAEEFVVEADENNLYTFIDDNAVLSQFEVTVMNGQVIELTDSTLQIQVDTGETAWITMTAKNEGIGFVTLALESHQTLAELCADTPVYYAAVKEAPVVTTMETTTTTTTTETTTDTTEITTTSSSTSQTTSATTTSTSSEVTTTTAETTLSTTTTQTTNSSLQTTPATATSTTQATTSQTTPITTSTEQMTSTTTTTLMSQTTATSSESTSTTTNVTPESTITNTEMTTEVTSTTKKATENTTTTAISIVTSAGTTVTSTTTGTGKTIPSTPNVPKQDTPSTGDERTSVLPLVFAGMGLVLIAGVLFLDKKVHSHEEKK